MNKNKYTNKLIHENSPYLLQHAHNPVKWYPFSDKAFEKAQKQDKPIFLSVGYSTCHWCHVMERESFQNLEIAEILNKNFISVKVDRETRPDVDAIYMEAVQAMTGTGGWPMSVFLTPDSKPFFGGTYFPPVESFGRPGFKDVITKIADLWNNNRDEITNSAKAITQHLTNDKTRKKGRLNEEIFATAFDILQRVYDRVNGGFGSSPKFPQPAMINFLFEFYYKRDEKSALEMAFNTLDSIADGGICDQLGGGFHRYSTDHNWFAPHFEKMLYDQAQLMKVYTIAYQLSEDYKYKKIVNNIYGFMDSWFRDTNGGFYSALDADSEGVEGKFYLWNAAEINKYLSSDHADIFKTRFGVKTEGNFENGQNILHVDKSVEEIAAEFKKSPGEISEILQQARNILLQIRKKRKPPFLDDKILTDWNGLTIEALAYAGRVFENANYTKTAQQAANFIFKNQYHKTELLHSFRESKSEKHGFLEDYSYMINALIELYHNDNEPDWLTKADKLAMKMIDNYLTSNGLFQQTSQKNEKLYTNNIPLYDGVVPSGNSSAVSALFKLAELTYNQKYKQTAKEIIENSANEIKSSPHAHLVMLSSLDFARGKSSEIVIVESPHNEQNKEIKKLFNTLYLPNSIMITIPHKHDNRIFKINSFLENFKTLNDKTTVYVCENFTCKEPINDIEKLKQLYISK